MRTSSDHLVKLTRWPILQRQGQIKNYMHYLTLDLQLATKFVGVQMYVFDYLGDKVGSKVVLEGYQHVMQDFLTKGINHKKQTAAILIHQHYPYNESNRNCWNEKNNGKQKLLNLVLMELIYYLKNTIIIILIFNIGDICMKLLIKNKKILFNYLIPRFQIVHKIVKAEKEWSY